MQYFDPELNENYVPYVVETSVGLRPHVPGLAQPGARPGRDRARCQRRRCHAYRPAPAPGRWRPVKCAVLPLLKNKEELTGKAREVFDSLKHSFLCQYDEKDAIGRRYRRQDAIGTPFCVTIDFETLQDDTPSPSASATAWRRSGSPFSQ
jgi:glycyl-tRNA synthetase